jgi:hypothetical protein
LRRLAVGVRGVPFGSGGLEAAVGIELRCFLRSDRGVFPGVRGRGVGGSRRVRSDDTGARIVSPKNLSMTATSDEREREREGERERERERERDEW